MRTIKCRVIEGVFNREGVRPYTVAPYGSLRKSSKMTKKKLRKEQIASRERSREWKAFQAGREENNTERSKVRGIRIVIAA